MARKPVTGLAVICCFVLGWLAGAHGVVLEVQNGNSTCIKAEISANFTIAYSTLNGTRTVVVPLPDSAAVGNGSSCGGGEVSPQLQASFGVGHFLSLVFSSNGQMYHVANLILSYNLSDNTTFPQSSNQSVVVLNTNTSEISARLNTTYRCTNPSSVDLEGPGVKVTFFDLRMQAYMPSANLSTNETVCSADIPGTTAAPVTSTTISPTTPVPPTVPEPGNYSLVDVNGTACLLARMGLQLNVTYFSKSQNKTVVVITNMQPNRTSSSGSCESTTATLLLTGDVANLSFIFTLNSTTNKYYLSTLNMSASWPDMTAPLSVGNSSLQNMEATLGHSYMCNIEEVLPVVSSFSLNTFNLQVQPFAVHNNQFGPADVCRMERDNMLVPIIVGAALAGLVLIVLIAYLIGRKRSHAGYQTI